jgi:hypothetical protein
MVRVTGETRDEIGRHANLERDLETSFAPINLLGGAIYEDEVGPRREDREEDWEP